MKKAHPRRTHSQPLQVRVAPDLYKLFEDAASASSLSLSAWARERLTQAARRELRHAGMVGGGPRAERN
jgi:predicted HicB family RNase H-like nuclease